MNHQLRPFRNPLPLMVSASILLGSFLGCEETTMTTNNAQPQGAQSTYGKAKESAERTIDKINQRQEELSNQADSIFDDGS